jgi:NAD kinase
MKGKVLLLSAVMMTPAPSLVHAFSSATSLSSRHGIHLYSCTKLHSSKKTRGLVDKTAAELHINGQTTTTRTQEPTKVKKAQSSKPLRRNPRVKRKIALTYCNHDSCITAIREQVVGEHNHMELVGPATGQVVYSWEKYVQTSSSISTGVIDTASPPAVLMLVKRDERELTKVAANAIVQLIKSGVQILVEPTFLEELEDLEEFSEVDVESDMIRLFDPKPVPGFGTGDQLNASVNDTSADDSSPADLSDPDLIVTLGGDGTIMHAAHVFSGPVPPILPIAGGSMGFLTPFAREEILDAILISLGMQSVESKENDGNMNGLSISSRANNNMLVEDISRESYYLEKTSLSKFGRKDQICISMRMRLDCRIFGSDGTLRSRYNVLNEVVIDRGSSPYLVSCAGLVAVHLV